MESTAAEVPVEFPSVSQAVTDAVAVVWFMVTLRCSLHVLGSASNWPRRRRASLASEATTVVSYPRVARDSDFTTCHIQRVGKPRMFVETEVAKVDILLTIALGAHLDIPT